MFEKEAYMQHACELSQVCPIIFSLILVFLSILGSYPYILDMHSHTSQGTSVPRELPKCSSELLILLLIAEKSRKCRLCHAYERQEATKAQGMS